MAISIRNKWVAGCLVDCIDWVDGKSIYLNIRYWKPGKSIERKPDREKSVLIPLAEADKVRNNLHSIVNHFMFV